MSIKISAAVWQHSRLRGTSLLCLLAIADRARDDGFAWPSMKDIARRARISERSAMRHVHKAGAAGELYVRSRPGRVNQYVVLAGRYPHEVEQTLYHRFELSDEEIAAYIGRDDMMSGVSPETRGSDVIGGGHGDIPDGGAVTPLSAEPLTKHKSDQTSGNVKINAIENQDTRIYGKSTWGCWKAGS